MPALTRTLVAALALAGLLAPARAQDAVDLAKGVH